MTISKGKVSDILELKIYTRNTKSAFVLCPNN